MEKIKYSLKITKSTGGVFFDTIEASNMEELNEKAKRQYPFALKREIIDRNEGNF